MVFEQLNMAQLGSKPILHRTKKIVRFQILNKEKGYKMPLSPCLP